MADNTNSGFKINKSVAIGTVILLLILIIQSAATYGVINSNVSENVEDIGVLQLAVHKQEVELQVLKSQLESISDDLKEIKSLLREK